MSESDEEYLENHSDDEPRTTNGYGTRSSGRGKGKQAVGQPARSKERWEDIQRSWDLVTEGADGSLAGTVEGLLEAGKRKRLLRDTTPLQRGIIRHVVLIIDMSSAMLEKDLRPSRYLLTLRHASSFVSEFFEQNPISQLGILGMRDGLALRISDLSGNPAEHIAALANLRTQEPRGNPSLQNALEMARAALFHTPTHGTREVLIIFGALLSSDPGDIHSTIRALVADRVRCAVVGLAARIAICSELCARTNGGAPGAKVILTRDSNNVYGVALHEAHFRDLLLAHTTPPVSRAADAASLPSLLQMGFPSRVDEAFPTLCACHGVASRGGYLCSRCKAKVCGLPSQCPTCDLQLVQSTHLARSYHHLFPLRNYAEVSWPQARKAGSTTCFGCQTSFPAVPDTATAVMGGENGVGTQHRHSGGGKPKKTTAGGASESARYACTVCERHFCIDCDVLAHEVVHNCAGCLCRPAPVVPTGENGHEQDQSGTVTNGSGVSIAATG